MSIVVLHAAVVNRFSAKLIKSTATDRVIHHITNSNATGFPPLCYIQLPLTNPSLSHSLGSGRQALLTNVRSSAKRGGREREKHFSMTNCCLPYDGATCCLSHLEPAWPRSMAINAQLATKLVHFWEINLWRSAWLAKRSGNSTTILLLGIQKSSLLLKNTPQGRRTTLKRFRSTTVPTVDCRR